MSKRNTSTMDQGQPDPFTPGIPPVWNDWSGKDQVTLWEAVALACNLDLATMRFHYTASHGKVSASTPVGRIAELLGMAKSSIGAGGKLKLAAHDERGLEESQVP